MERRTGTGSAPGKAILGGEHFVVHGAPAIAVPVPSVGKRARVDLELAAGGEGAPADAVPVTVDDPFADHASVERLVRDLLARLDARGVASLRIAIESTLPTGAHLGSSASLAVAVTRAVSDALALGLDDEAVCAQAFHLEKLFHRNPSGIDNTVIAHGKPVYYRKGEDVQDVEITLAADVVLGDTGVVSSTAEVVAAVGRFAGAQPGRFAVLAAEAASLVDALRDGLGGDDAPAVGRLLDRNQELLAEVGASSPELDRLVAAARGAGALGAKLTGGGGGGHMLALCAPGAAGPVRAALAAAGAVGTIVMRFPLAAGASAGGTP